MKEQPIKRQTNNNMNDHPLIIIIWLSVACLSGFSLGYTLGIDEGYHKAMREAHQKGYAHYNATDDKITWKEDTK